MTPRDLIIRWCKDIEYPRMVRELKFLSALNNLNHCRCGAKYSDHTPFPGASKTIQVRIPVRFSA